MARDANGFTPTQARIAHVLKDGKWHSRQEIVRAIDHELECSSAVLEYQLNRFRAIIDKKNEVLVSQFKEGQWYWRWGKLMAPAING